MSGSCKQCFLCEGASATLWIKTTEYVCIIRKVAGKGMGCTINRIFTCNFNCNRNYNYRFHNVIVKKCNNFSKSTYVILSVLTRVGNRKSIPESDT